jgi:hypothetical protein
MTSMRERPSDMEIGEWVAAVRPRVLARVGSGGWLRRLRPPLVAGAVVGAVAVGGLAYAAVERTRAPGPAPEIRHGSSVVEIGRPAAGDRWLNLSITYRCRAGERFAVRDDRHELVAGRCKDDDGRGLTSRGIAKSVPADDVRGTRLSVVSDLSREYRVDATWGPRRSMPMAQAMPSVGPDGVAAWDLPRYPVNEYGLTVGDSIKINTPESAWPDLLRTTYRGRVAYFKTSEEMAMPGSPEEAVRQMKQRRALGLDVDGRQYRFVYAADGTTRLGKIHIGDSRSE